MTELPDDDNKCGRDPIGKIGKYIGGTIVGFGTMLVATFIPSAASFEQKLAVWAIPLVGTAAVLLAVWGWTVRKRSALFSAGLWTGLVLGLLLSSACFNAV